MASKKPATKARKAAKPAAARSGGRKAAAHRTQPRKAPASTRRARPAQEALRPAARPSAGGRSDTAKSPAAKRPAHPAAPVRTPAAPRRAPLPAATITTPIREIPRVVVDIDEQDHADPGSLLAGPRNVKPYIAKRGEQYMGKHQLGHFQQILLNWKRDLMVEVDRTVTHMKDEAANFPDPNDRATQEEEFSLELRTRDRERKLIRKIDDALKRIEDGSYGYCLETGEEIGIKRLEARPVATLSLEAQERRERRERQYGDRDDRYR
jgi:DnaK suppressor protein